MNLQIQHDKSDRNLLCRDFRCFPHFWEPVTQRGGQLGAYLLCSSDRSLQVMGCVRCAQKDRFELGWRQENSGPPHETPEGAKQLRVGRPGRLEVFHGSLRKEERHHGPSPIAVDG